MEKINPSSEPADSKLEKTDSQEDPIIEATGKPDEMNTDEEMTEKTNVDSEKKTSEETEIISNPAVVKQPSDNPVDLISYEDNIEDIMEEIQVEMPKLPEFRDVPENVYYWDAVRWAYLHHLITGYDDMTFGPNDPVTREQVAVIMRNYAEMTGMQIFVENQLSRFEDWSDIHNWALEALAWANQVQLIRGVSDTEIDPGSHATRAQIATIIDRFVEMLRQA